MADMVVDPGRPHLGGNLVHPDGSSYWPQVWQYLVHRFAPVCSVLDVGCGTGEALRWFESQGRLAIGLEGLACNAMRCGCPVAIHDLTSGPLQFCGIDLVWCAEVAEHIEERYVGNLMDTLCVGRVVAMTHAVPGQGGHHHVNCRDDVYWLELFRSRRYVLDLDATNETRMLTKGTFWSQSGLILKRATMEV